MPLGLKPWFADNGMTRVEELDWWQAREHRGLRFVCVPAQHFSARSLWDENRRLWASWVLGRPAAPVLRAGTPATSAGFQEIGEAPGPVRPRRHAHRRLHARRHHEASSTPRPRRRSQAFEDLARAGLLGIHWGTFDLAEEPLDEPPRRVA